MKPDPYKQAAKRAWLSKQRQKKSSGSSEDARVTIATSGRPRRTRTETAAENLPKSASSEDKESLSKNYDVDFAGDDGDELARQLRASIRAISSGDRRVSVAQQFQFQEERDWAVEDFDSSLLWKDIDFERLAVSFQKNYKVETDDTAESLEHFNQDLLLMRGRFSQTCLTRYMETHKQSKKPQKPPTIARVENPIADQPTVTLSQKPTVKALPSAASAAKTKFDVAVKPVVSVAQTATVQSVQPELTEPSSPPVDTLEDDLDRLLSMKSTDEPKKPATTTAVDNIQDAEDWLDELLNQ